VNGFEKDGNRECEPVLRWCGGVGADTVNDWKGDLFEVAEVAEVVVVEPGEMGDVVADDDEVEMEARVGSALVVVIVGEDMNPPA